MKLTVIPGRYDGCYYYRCLLPAIKNGWSLPDVKNGVIDWDSAFKHAIQSDVVLFQRPSDNNRIEAIKLLKEKGKKIVFDNDDTYLPDKGIPLARLTDKGQEILKQMNENIYEAIKLSDLVITTTEFLANEYRKIHNNVIVLPNCINPIEKEKKIINTTNKKRIGFIGSVLTNEDYVHIKDQLEKLSKEYTLVVFGLKNADGSLAKPYEEDVEYWETLNPEWHPFVPMNEYYHTLNKLALDVVMIPREDSYFNRCKSNLKFLEASLLEIPVVAQGFTTGDSPYQGVEDSKHMRIVINNGEWYDAIKETLENPTITAYQYVLDNYNIKNNAYLWQKEINKLCE